MDQKNTIQIYGVFILAVLFQMNKRRLAEDDDMFSCQVCFENYESSGNHLPRIFPCSHTACHKCVKQLIEETGHSVYDSILHRLVEEFKCPKCRKKHIACYGAISFPENPYLVKMVEDRERRRAEDFQLCIIHNRELSFYCRDAECDTAICSLCLVKGHLNHNVIDLIEEHRERLETRIEFLNMKKKEQELVRDKGTDSLKTLMEMKNQHMNEFDSMISDVENNIARAEGNIDSTEEELEEDRETGCICICI